MKRIIFTAAFAAFYSAPVNATTIDCWWDEPTGKLGSMTPRDCDISRRVTDGQTFIDVWVKGKNERFSLWMTYENKSDGYGTVVFYVKGRKYNGHWQFDEHSDVLLGFNGRKTHFAFSAKQLVDAAEANGKIPSASETLSDTPFHF